MMGKEKSPFTFSISKLNPWACSISKTHRALSALDVINSGLFPSNTTPPGIQIFTVSGSELGEMLQLIRISQNIVSVKRAVYGNVCMKLMKQTNKIAS